MILTLTVNEADVVVRTMSDEMIRFRGRLTEGDADFGVLLRRH